MLEATQDPLTRRAEGWKARSTPPLGQSHLLPARRYAVSIHNLCVPRHSDKTRTEMHSPAPGRQTSRKCRRSSTARSWRM